MRRLAKKFAALALPVGTFLLLVATAQACPMCSQSIAEEDALPHAYMYSIIFMLSMPVVVFGGIGTAIWLQIRKAGALAPLSAAELPGEAAPVRKAELVPQP